MILNLNLKEIQRELDLAEIQEDDDGSRVKTIYLGSILDLSPSGKVWTAWAKSNVTCEEAEADVEWFDELEAELATIDAFPHTSEGDGCDIMITQVVEDYE